jgi:hypothetical protein
MSEILPFLNRFIEESVARNSRHILLDQDFNKGCSEVYDTPVDLTPKGLGDSPDFVPYHNPQILNVYPSKADEEDYLKKAELLNNSIHRISNHVAYEIRGNNKQITCGFYGERDDLEIISSSVRNYYPNSHLELHQPDGYSGDFFVYTIFPRAPFYRSLSTYHDFFVVSPLNMIPQILLQLDKNSVGVYRVIIKHLGDEVHGMVSDSIDTEWQASQGEAGQNKVLPSLQGGIIGERLTYKSPEFRQYYSVCVQLILPTDTLTPMVKSFVSNFNYGQKGFTIYDNQHYSQEQVCEMLNKRVSYNTGFLVNSHELTSLLHIPYQILSDKVFNDIFKAVPAGDKPLLTATNKDICIGDWACGDSAVDVHLGLSMEVPHMQIVGISRSGKSIKATSLAIDKASRGETCFVSDPTGDLTNTILRMIPKKLKDKVIVIDFTRKEIPQITIKGNVDLSDPSKVSDDMAEAMQDVGTSRDNNFWGPKMAYYFSCLYYIYCVIPWLNLTHIRLLASPKSNRAKVLRGKIKSHIDHPVIKSFIEEMAYVSNESVMPVLQRLSLMLLPDTSLRLFTLKENKISIKDIMDNGQLCLINYSVGIIGKQRASILSGLFDSLINNNILARANIPYHKRCPVTYIKDEFYLGSGDIDFQITNLAKYGLNVIAIHQYLEQIDGKTREVLGTVGTKLVFKTRRKDAEILAKELNIEPEDITSLKKFQCYLYTEGEAVKVNGQRPVFPEEDYSEDIIGNCLDKYYLKHDYEEKTVPKKEILEFDKL